MIERMGEGGAGGDMLRAERAVASRAGVVEAGGSAVGGLEVAALDAQAVVRGSVRAMARSPTTCVELMSINRPPGRSASTPRTPSPSGSSTPTTSTSASTSATPTSPAHKIPTSGSSVPCARKSTRTPGASTAPPRAYRSIHPRWARSLSRSSTTTVTKCSRYFQRSKRV